MRHLFKVQQRSEKRGSVGPSCFTLLVCLCRRGAGRTASNFAVHCPHSKLQGLATTRVCYPHVFNIKPSSAGDDQIHTTSFFRRFSMIHFNTLGAEEAVDPAKIKMITHGHSVGGKKKNACGVFGGQHHQFSEMCSITITTFATCVTCAEKHWPRHELPKLPKFKTL